MDSHWIPESLIYLYVINVEFLHLLPLLFNLFVKSHVSLNLINYDGDLSEDEEHSEQDEANREASLTDATQRNLLMKGTWREV